MVFSSLFGQFGCGRGSKKEVTSAEEMTLVLRGMRGGVVYKFEGEGDAAELRRYREVYASGKCDLALETEVPCGEKMMTELMNTGDVLRWDGFHGKHPKNVHDGMMFTFSATVNGGQTIRAEGSANFPRGYHEFIRALNAMLTACENG